MATGRHKKLNLQIPAWLSFGICPAGSGEKMTEEKMAMALRIKKNLERFLQEHDLSNPIITEPNQFDDARGYNQEI